MRRVVLFATLVLSGCYNPHVDEFTHQRGREESAANAVISERKWCQKGKELEQMSRDEYLLYIKCTNHAMERFYLPFASHPDLVRINMARQLENASLYSQGKITYDQVKARSDLASAEADAEINKQNKAEFEKRQQQDQKELQHIVKSLKVEQPKIRQPVQTHCTTSFGGTTCTTY